ncbi:MAG: glycosyltransferase [Promethearchaeota archaeon]
MSIYNGEKYIDKAINSILNQSYADFELIIIDDDSNDNSLEISKSYAKKDKRIKIIKNKKNIGLTKSLNKAINISRGEFIARQDVDDISLPNRLEKQLKFLENHPDFVFCGSDVTVKQNQYKSSKYLDFNKIKENLIINNCFTHSTILIRKKYLSEYGLYDEKYLYGQDYELWCRLIYRYNLKARNLSEKLVIMDIPNSRLSQKNIKFIIQHKNYIKTKIKYMKYIKNPKIMLKSFFSIIKNIIEIVYVFYFNVFRLKLKSQK